jgi:hypothetical protein
MKDLIELIILVPLFIMCYQFYAYSMTSKGVDRQKKCQMLGIAYTTVGICSLVFHSPVAVFGGLILIMLGFRLIARGLDRLDKNIYIDQYSEDNNPK